MNNERSTDNEASAGKRTDENDELVARLMSLAGPRADIPSGTEARVRDKVESEWLRATAGRRHRRRAVPLALAASVVLVAVAIGFRSQEITPPAAVGSFARVVGEAGGYAAGDTVYRGDIVDSADGLSFVLRDTTSIRLDGNSSLRVDDGDEFTLLSGRVYVDTGDAIYRDRPITIRTGLGSVTDVGTQFAVALQAAELQVAVREGRVDIATADDTVGADAGTRVVVAAGTLPVAETISPADADWDWAEALAPAFDLDGRSLLDFLKWVARETGMDLEFADEADRRAAMAEIMSGSIDDLTPMEALVSVMPTTSFDYVIDGDAISITH